jgi:hypothetical protein
VSLDRIGLVLCGCGTVGYWTAATLLGSGRAAGLAHVAAIDQAVIRAPNAITCPLYRGHAGRPKAARLAEMIRGWRPALPVAGMVAAVEQLEWPRLAALQRRAGAARIVVVVGLDRWQSRLTLVSDLREQTAGSAGGAVVAQVGIDRGRASLGVFGDRYDDPCPACGLSVLPETEPCTALDGRGRLQRGNLHKEARAAARWLRRLLGDCREELRPRRWINTKTVLTADRGAAGGFRADRHGCRAVPGCGGPHGPAAPVRLDQVVPRLVL